jgi:hypothetical protein
MYVSIFCFKFFDIQTVFRNHIKNRENIGRWVLPGLGRRLYGRKGGWRGWRRGRRQLGTVAAREEEGGGALEAAARA